MPNPVTVVTQAEINVIAPTNMIEGLAELPQFYQSSTTQNPGAFFTSDGAGSLNLRERPGMSGRVMVYLQEGVLLQVLGEAGDFTTGLWLRVRTDVGQTGWIYAPLCGPVDA